jgi:cytochrome P450
MWEEDAFEEYEFITTRVLARKVVLCNSPESIQFAFSTRNASFERKSPQERFALSPIIGDGHFITDGEHWKRRRRIISSIIHPTHLREFAPTMVEVAGEVRDRWLRRATHDEFDVLNEMAQLTAEIICRSVFGRELGHEHAKQVVDSFSEYQRQIRQLDIYSFFGLPDSFPRPRSKALIRAVQGIHDVLDNIIASYQARGKDADDVALVGRLMEARDEETGERIQGEALRNEVAVLFMAGHEGNANALTWTWYLLSQAPEVEAKLHEELDRVLGDREPTLADVPRLVYTRAVLDESMRLYPPVPFLSREALEEETFQGERIPRGSLIFVVPWLIHRHRKLWDKPDHFIPERFLPGNPLPSKFAYIPFSIGPRVCSGMGFGITEGILCVATVAQALRLKLKVGCKVEPICRLTLRPAGGLPMSAHRREGHHQSRPQDEPRPRDEPTALACPL